MKLIVITIIAAMFAACSTENNENLRLFTSPIDGTEILFEKQDIPGWEVYQLADAPGQWLTIAKLGQPIVYIVDFKTGRSISTGETSDVSLVDSDYDGHIDQIDFYSSNPTVGHRATLSDGIWSIKSSDDQDDGT